MSKVQWLVYWWGLADAEEPEKEAVLRTFLKGLPWQSSGWDYVLTLQWVQGWSLTSELRSWPAQHGQKDLKQIFFF